MCGRIKGYQFQIGVTGAFWGYIGRNQGIDNNGYYVTSVSMKVLAADSIFGHLPLEQQR